MNTSQRLTVSGKPPQWLHGTTDTHHVFQDQHLRGGPRSIFVAKIERILLGYKSCSVLPKQSPGILAVPHQPQIKRRLR